MPPKKPEVKDDTLNKLIFIFLGLFLLWVLIERLLVVLNYYFSGGYDSLWQRTEVYFLQYIWPIMKMLAVIISVGGIYGIYKVVSATMQIRQEERMIYGSTEVGVEELEAVGGSSKNEKWEQVQLHINSKNPSEWRLAIIEADIMLDELLKASGYHGDTVGERLKAVEPSDFTSLEAAWEAHKVRNQIAHQGSSFDISEREARRVITLFETVFREFNII